MIRECQGGRPVGSISVWLCVVRAPSRLEMTFRQQRSPQRRKAAEKNRKVNTRRQAVPFSPKHQPTALVSQPSKTVPKVAHGLFEKLSLSLVRPAKRKLLGID